MIIKYFGKLAIVLFLISTIVACGNAMDLDEEMNPGTPVNGEMDQEDLVPNEDQTESNLEENGRTEEPELNDVEAEESWNSEDFRPEVELEEVK